MSTESNQFRYLLQLLHDEPDEIEKSKIQTKPLPGSLPRRSTLQIDENVYEEADYPSQGSTHLGFPSWTVVTRVVHGLCILGQTSRPDSTKTIT